jgi:negative regulator of sigma-B (phosphoserine phosphatase)
MGLVIGSAQRCLPGQTVCGDQHAIVRFPGGALVCLADGLGHGAEAYTAAETACQQAREHAEEPIEALMRRLDSALAATRGAAVSLVTLRPADGRLRFAGVGNVELRSRSRARIDPPTMPGIVGHGLRAVRVWEYPLACGDLLVLMSDGISSRFDLDQLAHLDPQGLADTLLAHHHKSHDDACVVVVRVTAAQETA